MKAGVTGDYFELRDFVDSILHDTDPPMDVYDAMDYTVPGLVSEQSIANGGAPVEVPNFRPQATEQWNSYLAQKWARFVEDPFTGRKYASS